MKKLLVLVALLLVPLELLAVQVEGVRLWTAPDHTRLVFDTTGPAEHKVFSLSGPDRLVIDFAKTSLARASESMATGARPWTSSHVKERPMRRGILMVSR